MVSTYSRVEITSFTTQAYSVSRRWILAKVEGILRSRRVRQQILCSHNSWHQHVRREFLTHFVCPNQHLMCMRQLFQPQIVSNGMCIKVTAFTGMIICTSISQSMHPCLSATDQQPCSQTKTYNCGVTVSTTCNNARVDEKSHHIIYTACVDKGDGFHLFINVKVPPLTLNDLTSCSIGFARICRADVTGLETQTYVSQSRCVAIVLHIFEYFPEPLRIFKYQNIKTYFGIKLTERSKSPETDS